MTNLYVWLKFFHLIGLAVFLFAHGVSGGASLALRAPVSPESRRLLRLSQRSGIIANPSLLVLIVTRVWMAYWSPAIVGRLNDYKIQVVKVKGEFTWHTHEGTDEFFLVLAGELAIRLRDREVRLGAGEVFVVPRGVEHCPFAKTDCQLLLIEPSGTVNTGEAGGDLTVEERSI